MTIGLMLMLLVGGSAIASLLTEAIKKFVENIGKTVKPNIVALIMAFVVGGLGTIGFYLVAGIEFNTVNIIGIICMVLANWVGSMIGYDKVIQTIQQIGAKNGEISKSE